MRRRRSRPPRVKTAGKGHRKTLSSAGRSGNQVLYFAAAGPKCQGMLEGSECWREISNKPDCYVWRPHYQPSWDVEWSGRCSGDTAHGRGVLHSSGADSSSKGEGTGEIVHGKLQGHWTWRTADSDNVEGPYVDGKMHGRWTWRTADGDVFEGLLVDGKLQGDWVER